MLHKKKIYSLALCAFMMAGNCQTAWADIPIVSPVPIENSFPSSQGTTETVSKQDTKHSSLMGPSSVPVSTVSEPITGYLGGSKLTMLANQSHCQILSLLLETNSGNLMMIDGGTLEDAPYLTQKLLEKGGHVSTWLITHPHSDHVGALNEILTHPEWGITIDNIYYSFLPASWYEENEPQRADVMAQTTANFSKLPEQVLHGDIFKGQEIVTDNIKTTVMNLPYQFSGNSINNSSVAYMLDINGKRALILGDMGTEAAGQLLADYSPEALACDIVQMSHHGQYGADFNFYKSIRPEICLWSAPQWLWDNEGDGGFNTGIYRTVETRQWMASLGVPYHLSIKDGDQTIQ